MTEIKRDEAFKAKLLELVTVVKELHNLAKLSFPNGNPYISSRFELTAIFMPKSKKYVNISALIFDKGENKKWKNLMKPMQRKS